MRRTPKRPLDHQPEAVTYAREQAGLTQTQLADMCGVTKSLVCEIEAGTRNATPAMIRKLASALNCPRVILERKRESEAPTSTAGPMRELRNDERAVEQEVPGVPATDVERSA